MATKDPASLERNNVQAAVRFFAEHVLSGTWRQEYGQQLIMLQDNPEELTSAIREKLESDSELRAEYAKFTDRR